MQVGTYSCHGVEPSYSGGGDDDEGVTAKINQDRGCVVYPFNGDAKHALFSVFDGKLRERTSGFPHVYLWVFAAELIGHWW